MCRAMFELIALVECAICVLMFALPPRWAAGLLSLMWAPLIFLLSQPTEGRGLLFLGLLLGPVGLVMLLLSVVRFAQLIRLALRSSGYRGF